MEKDGILAIDDAIVEYAGRNIEATVCKPILYCAILNWCKPDKGMEMLMNNSPPGTVYTKEVVEYANRIRDAGR